MSHLLAESEISSLTHPRAPSNVWQSPISSNRDSEQLSESPIPSSQSYQSPTPSTNHFPFEPESPTTPTGGTPPPPPSDGQPAVKSNKRLVLCFDGTGNQFGETTSNVVRFFDALRKDNPEQLCYYQPGIGTYSSRQYHTRFVAWASQKLEEALARELNVHVKEGYEFIMRNYNPGDKIFLFGFSRGAYIARALSGMLYKVGLLPRFNDRLVDPAYIMYNSYDKNSAVLAKKFKKSFALDVQVQFVGVWDTVSSVGIIPTTLPFSTYNDGVKTFRHALALDERRARFRPCLWGEPQTTREILENEPKINYRSKDIPRDKWNFEPIELTDVKEVWFVGCHADVGGGSHKDMDEEDNSLANIPLRWMVVECFKANTGIDFDQDALLDLGFKKEVTVPGYKWKEWKRPAKSFDFSHDPEEDQDHKNTQSDPPPERETSVPFDPNLQPWVGKDIIVASVAEIFDQLKVLFFWWLLEFIPTMALFQTQLGWLITRERNRGRGRYLPVGEDEIYVHASVFQRMKHERQREKDREIAAKTNAPAGRAPDPKETKPARAAVPRKPTKPYEPAARNWHDMLKNNQLTWVY